MLRIIRDDPFATINQIKREINDSDGGEILSWWQVFNILRQRGLLTKRARFRYVWGSRG
ncbi:MAG TPA: hypothetical protein PLF13_06310 [candidate division Zixibacteria bacterium]|nr:hypothetical protein [candidate division Zixibacteria bacterium]